MSMRGMGANDKSYTASQRFHSAQIGIGVPIFAGAQKARINSAKVSMQIAGQSYTAGVQNLKTHYQSLVVEHQKFLATAAYYETTALKNAGLITKAANEQLANGSINYLEWAQLVNQAAAIRIQYADAVYNLNNTAIQLNNFLEN